MGYRGLSDLLTVVLDAAAGATTNSDSGVTKIDNIYPALEAMSEVGMPLLVHGEVTDPSVDLFDREATFVEEVIKPLVAKFPQLKVVMEHITTKEAAEFVTNAPANVAATITPQHLLYNRNAIFQGGLRPHKYCLPVLKRETHRQALLQAVASGSKKFFLGTDSAPHVASKKESGCGCAASTRPTLHSSCTRRPSSPSASWTCSAHSRARTARTSTASSATPWARPS